MRVSKISHDLQVLRVLETQTEASRLLEVGVRYVRGHQVDAQIIFLPYVVPHICWVAAFDIERLNAHLSRESIWSPPAR